MHILQPVRAGHIAAAFSHMSLKDLLFKQDAVCQTYCKLLQVHLTGYSP